MVRGRPATAAGVPPRPRCLLLPPSDQWVVSAAADPWSAARRHLCLLSPPSRTSGGGSLGRTTTALPPCRLDAADSSCCTAPPPPAAPPDAAPAARLLRPDCCGGFDRSDSPAHLSFFCFLSSGRYLSSSLNSVSAWFLSSWRVKNWFTWGGTLRRIESTRFWRCRRTYLGHLTNRCRSVLCGGTPPRPVRARSHQGARDLRLRAPPHDPPPMLLLLALPVLLLRTIGLGALLVERVRDLGRRSGLLGQGRRSDLLLGRLCDADKQQDE